MSVKLFPRLMVVTKERKKVVKGENRERRKTKLPKAEKKRMIKKSKGG